MLRTAVVLILMMTLHAGALDWPDAVDPLAGMGVNIHFTNPKPGELEMLSQAGFRWVRMDFGWEATERKPGLYDFSAYDRLLAALDKFHLRALLIMDYGNKLYDSGLSPHTDESRAAFARWAAAAATHFQGRGVIWEIWNEPNGHFWNPHVNADDYAKLALAASRAIRAAAPQETIVGPAICDADTGFLEPAVAGGILDEWSGITIHPYYRLGPESYGSAYAKIRNYLKGHVPAGKNVEVMCGESGYSSAWWGVDEKLQGTYFARLMLFDVLSGVPLTIWYDWHEDGTKPTEPEHHFGIVRHEYHTGATEVYDRKPAYDAARTYSSQLGGLRFVERISTKSDSDYVLHFAASGRACFVAWTSDWSAHDIHIPLPNGAYTLTSYDGKTHSTVEVTNQSLKLRVDGAPQYLTR